MAQETVKVKGLRELQRALREYDADLLKELKDELRQAGAVVQQEAARLLGTISPASAQGLKVRVRARGVAVEQSRKRTTGLRPDFGRLQMNRALLPALESKEAEVERHVEGMLDRLGETHGF